MPRVKKNSNTTSLRAREARRGNLIKKIALSSKTPRNDRRISTRVSLSVPVCSLAGRAAGNLSLPKEFFGAEVNKKLLAQALRVYTTNQKSLTGNTKTRGEVEGSTAKIYRQKGTGRARHGAIRAPIFVGGGITFGPKERKVRLDLPQKMKKSALKSALSSKVIDKSVMGLSGIEKASGKTKEIAKLMYQVSSIRYQGKDKKSKKITSTLIVTGDKVDNILRGARNIPGVDILTVNLINAYEVARHDLLLITKEAVDVLSGKGKAERVKL